MNDNNENIEEVPLDLFDQVTLDDTETIETVELEEPKQEEEPSNPATVISIPVDAYARVMAEMNNAANSQSNQ